MINRRMAENYLSEARIIFQETEESLTRGHFHRTVRLSQETFELAMKACLRAVGVEHPKEHELSEAVMESQNRFPDWMKNQLESLCDASIWLAERCGPAMYGDEVGGLPASQLFTLEDAQIAVQYARKALEVADRLLSELK